MKSDQLKAIHALLDARKANPPGSLQEARDGYDQLCGTFAAAEGWTFKEERLNATFVLHGRSGDSSAQSNTLLYVHGGGFMVGSAKGFQGLASELGKNAGTQVFVVDYRLAPEYSKPAARDDVLAAYKTLLDKGIASSAIALAGDSAGAYLILSAMLKAKADGLPLPSSLLLLSPWVDLSLSGLSMSTKADEDVFLTPAKLAGCAKAYLGESGVELLADGILESDLSGFPPLMIQVGSAEILLDDALRLANKAVGENVMTRLEVWPDMFHVWQAFAPQLQEGKEALKQGAQFLAQHFGDENK